MIRKTTCKISTNAQALGGRRFTTKTNPTSNPTVNTGKKARNNTDAFGSLTVIWCNISETKDCTWGVRKRASTALSRL